MARIVTISEGKEKPRGRAEATTAPGNRVDHRHQIGATDWLDAKKWVLVKSSNVSGLYYDTSEHKLMVEFLTKDKRRGGSVYEYYNVPRNTARSLFNAPSVGSALDRLVKKKGYSYRQIKKG